MGKKCWKKSKNCKIRKKSESFKTPSKNLEKYEPFSEFHTSIEKSIMLATLLVHTCFKPLTSSLTSIVYEYDSGKRMHAFFITWQINGHSERTTDSWPVPYFSQTFYSLCFLFSVQFLILDLNLLKDSGREGFWTNRSGPSSHSR